MDDILHHPYKDFLDLEEFLGQMDLEGHLGPNGGQVLQHNRKPVPIRDLVDDIGQEVGDLAVDDGQVRRIDGGQELGDVLEAAQDNVEAHLVRNIVDDAEKDFLNIGNDPLGLGLGPNRRLNRQEVAQNSVEAHPIGDVLDNVKNILLILGVEFTRSDRVEPRLGPQKSRGDGGQGAERGGESGENRGRELLENGRGKEGHDGLGRGIVTAPTRHLCCGGPMKKIDVASAPPRRVRDDTHSP